METRPDSLYPGAVALSGDGGGQTGGHYGGTLEPEGEEEGPGSGLGHLLSSEWDGWQPFSSQKLTDMSSRDLRGYTDPPQSAGGVSRREGMTEMRGRRWGWLGLD